MAPSQASLTSGHLNSSNRAEKREEKAQQIDENSKCDET